MGYRLLAAAAAVLLVAGVGHDAEAETEALLLRRSTMVAAFAADDPGSPSHLATFSCAFTSHTATGPAIRHQGRVRALGACLVSDRDGGTYAIELLSRPPKPQLCFRLDGKIVVE